MDAYINECITGKYDYVGEAIVYGDTDSEIGTTVHQTNFGEKTIEELFDTCSEFWNDGEKEYAYHPDLMVMSYDSTAKEPYLGHIDFIYRHKVTKDLYEIEDELGNIVTVTEDHSVMIERKGQLIEVKPAEIEETDVLISIKITNKDEISNLAQMNELKNAFRKLILSNSDDPAELLREVRNMLASLAPPKTLELHRAKVKSVKKARRAENEYVYDISMKNQDQPWYFGNNILIHNSAYFSAWPIIKDDVLSGKMEWNKDICVKLYDSIGDAVNESFPAAMEKAFNCPRDLGSIIRGGRELVASKGLFITKKRYAVMIYDKEKQRLDVNGKPGKVKAMGLDLKRSDTPKVMQDFLSKILLDVLTGATEKEILAQIVEFRNDFSSKLKPWEKGSPKRVNKLTYYSELEKKNGKTDIPWHVRAALNWNNLKKMHGDNYSQSIVDGQKVIICKLRSNAMNYNTIAYPIDEPRIPEWFQNLPFDQDLMEATIVDKKVSNLLGVLDWDLSSTAGVPNAFNAMFG